MIESENPNSSNEWSEYLLIIPAISVGNVGQLAVDLLLSTLNVKHVGYLRHKSVLPLVGPDPFDASRQSLMTSWEVYECEEHKLVIVQQRSPVISDRRDSYAQYIIEWFQKHKFRTLVLLSSCFAQFFSPEELQNMTLQYLCTEDIESCLDPSFKEFGWKKFIRHTVTEFIPGGGITESLLESCNTKQLPLVVLVLACSEGDNYPEAFLVANALNRWLKIAQKEDSQNVEWRIPASWHMPFGNAPPLALY